MRIDFSQASQTSMADKEHIQTEYRARTQVREDMGSGYQLDISGKVTDNAATGLYAKDGKETGQGKTIEDCLQGIQGQDMSLIHNYMAVMSNSLSSEDFAQMSKDGFHVGSLPADETVTVVDQIKVKLAQAGVDVAGYTDTLDEDTLRAVTGSEGRAQQIEAALRENDLPVTDRNKQEMDKALELADSLTGQSAGEDSSSGDGLSGDCIRYMLKNDMDPTLENVYLAQHSAQAGRSLQLSDQEVSQLQGQMEQVIQDAGLSVDETSLQNARWLIENDLPLTGENLTKLTDLKELTFPLEDGEVLEGAAEAITRGQSGSDALLIHRERVLAETRLSMTTEANRQLLDSEYSIETGDLQKQVESLKDLEKQLTDSAAKDSEDFSVLLQNAEDLTDRLQDIRQMPIDLIGQVSRIDDFTLTDVYEQGSNLQAKYQEAGELYEALRTEVRSDLGDSMSKAFQNVDDILSDMGMETTEENERAVRILGYNQMEINEESVGRIKEADREVSHVLDAMNPSAVLKLIRGGINPLTRSVEQLCSDLQENTTDEERDDKYSEFLWKMERSGQITDEEKESVIGLYRLFAQVEKSGGAAIGTLVNQGAEMTVSNLLSAVRTRKARGIDVTVDTSFGGLDSLVSSGNSISRQIEAVFQSSTYYEAVSSDILDKMDPEETAELVRSGMIDGSTTLEGLLDQMQQAAEQNEETRQELEGAYAREASEEIRRIADAEETVLQNLTSYDETVTLDQLQASGALIFNRGGLFRRLSSMEDESSWQEETRSLTEAFTDEESAQEAYGEMTEKALAAVREEMDNGNVSRERFEDLRLMNRQIRLIGSLARQENYEVPVVVDDQVTAVNLKIVRGTGESSVSAAMYLEDYGALALKLDVDGDKVSGYMLCGSSYGEEFLQEKSEQLTERLSEAGFDISSLPVMRKQGMKLSEMTTVNPAKEIEEGDSAQEDRVSTGDLYKAAKLFLQVIQES